MMNYVYIVGSIVVAFFWFVCYRARPDLRKKMLLTSIIWGILGFTELFFVPNYWNPQFQVIYLLEDLFLDSFVFAFFLAWFSCILYQVVFNKPLFKTQHIVPHTFRIPPVIFSLHLLIPQINVMVFCILSMLVGSLMLCLQDHKLIIPILWNGFLTFSFFLTTYFIFWQIFPSLVASYNYSVLSGIHIFTIPIEELWFFFAIGTVFAPMYEILSHSRHRHCLRYFYH